MNKLLAMKAFVSVVSNGSFTMAGRDLGLAVSSITKLVASLENEFGTRLLNRSTRKLEPTDSGATYYQRCLAILSGIEEAEDVVMDGPHSPRGALRVILPMSFFRVTVAPHLPRFLREYPDINLHVSFNDDLQSAATEMFDMAVGKGDLQASGLVTRVLTRGPLVTVGAPRYLEEKGRPCSIEDLRDHDCIVSRESQLWRFQEAGRPRSVAVSGRLKVASGDALLEAAVAGCGLAQGTWWLFRKALEQTTLTTVLSEHACEGDPMRVVLSEGKYLSKKARVFLEFLIAVTQRESAPASHSSAPSASP
ncbi:MAG: transcriptional regulator, LysR family [Hyphomicrobiales bacterium]|nr:transcriptional regulator, LysR family [Hyphomicrobiales bacterium]